MKLPAFLLLLFLAASVAKAGTGPETTLLVVNADSPLSLTLANQWLETRPIPRSHVVWLHGIPNLGTISMEGFRSRILEPVQGFLKQASLRSRERFWDIRVPKIDSIFDNSLVPRPSWSPGVPPQHRKLVAATHRSPI